MPTRTRTMKKRDQEDDDSDSTDVSVQESSKKKPKTMSANDKTIKIQEQEMQIAKLKAELKKKSPQVVRVVARKGTKKTREEATWARQISDANKRFNWGKVKFCNHEDKLTKLTGNIFDQWNLKEFKDLKGDELHAAKATWVAENSDYVRQAMNDVRNYAQSQLRDWVVTQTEAGKLVPTAEQVRKCALRDKEFLDTEEGMEIFAIYHDVLLRKVVGKHHWNDWIRHYSTISSAKHKNGDPCIAVNTEALLVALFDNCRLKWGCILEQRKKNKVDNKRKDSRYKCPYIDTDVGQAKWGGWNKKGRNEVRKLCKEIFEARKSEHVAEVEEACLKKVREINDIDERDKKRQEKGKKKRKAPVEEEESDDEFDQL